MILANVRRRSGTFIEVQITMSNGVFWIAFRDWRKLSLEVYKILIYIRNCEFLRPGQTLTAAQMAIMCRTIFARMVFQALVVLISLVPRTVLAATVDQCLLVLTDADRGEISKSPESPKRLAIEAELLRLRTAIREAQTGGANPLATVLARSYQKLLHEAQLLGISVNGLQDFETESRRQVRNRQIEAEEQARVREDSLRPFINEHAFTHQANVLSAEFSSDGSLLATSDVDGVVRVWNVMTGQMKHEITTHKKSVNMVRFNPDGNSFITASDDKTAVLWDIHTGKKIRSINGPEERVTNVLFSPDGSRIAIASADKKTLISDAKTGQQLQTFEVSFFGAESMAFTPDGQSFIAKGFNQVFAWDVLTGRALGKLGSSSNIDATKISPDSQRLVMVAQNYFTIGLLDIKSGTVVKEFENFYEKINSVQYSPDGRLILAASASGKVLLLDAETGEEKSVIPCEVNNHLTAEFSPSGRWIVLSSPKRAIIWDVQLGRALQELPFEASPHARFSPDSQHLLTITGHSVQIWNRRGN